MKKVLISFFVVAVALLFSNVSSISYAAEKVIEMKIASPFTNVTTNDYTPNGWRMNSEEGACRRRLDVKCYSNAQWGGELELINKLKAGAIHLTVNSFQVMSGFDDKAALGLLPFLFDTDEKAEKFLTSPMVEEVSKSLESQGVKNLGYLKFGRFCMSGKKSDKNARRSKGNED